MIDFGWATESEGLQVEKAFSSQLRAASVSGCLTIPVRFRLEKRTHGSLQPTSLHYKS